MTKQQFDYIWATKVVANGSWSFNATDEDTAILYREKLSRFSQSVFSKAVDMLLDSTEGYGKLPPVGIFLEYCRWSGEGKPKKEVVLCPCCCGDSWVYLKEEDHATPCDCNPVKPESRISNIYNPNKKCENFECDPDGKTFRNTKVIKLDSCPKGKAHYEKYKNISEGGTPF